MAEAEAQLVNHVPDELSVQVRAPASTDAAALYEQVRGALNAFVQDPPAAASAADANLAHDLRPRELIAARGTELVLPLGRHRQPWVVWPSQQDTWHFYYRLGDAPVGFA